MLSGIVEGSGAALALYPGDSGVLKEVQLCACKVLGIPVVFWNRWMCAGFWGIPIIFQDSPLR